MRNNLQVLKKQATLNDKQFEVLRELAYVYLKKKQYSDTDRWLYIGLPYTKNDNNKQATMLSLSRLDTARTSTLFRCRDSTARSDFPQ
jgi:hypothetical protein